MTVPSSRIPAGLADGDLGSERERVAGGQGVAVVGEAQGGPPDQPGGAFHPQPHEPVDHLGLQLHPGTLDDGGERSDLLADHQVPDCGMLISDPGRMPSGSSIPLAAASMRHWVESP